MCWPAFWLFVAQPPDVTERQFFDCFDSVLRGLQAKNWWDVPIMVPTMRATPLKRPTRRSRRTLSLFFASSGNAMWRPPEDSVSTVNVEPRKCRPVTWFAAKSKHIIAGLSSNRGNGWRCPTYQTERTVMFLPLLLCFLVFVTQLFAVAEIDREELKYLSVNTTIIFTTVYLAF